MKICSGCSKQKSRSEFYGNKASPDLLRHVCKDCDRKKNIEWRSRNKEHMREKVYRWRKENPDRYHAINAKSRAKNLSRIMVSNGERRAVEKRATPAWADKKVMQSFYKVAKQLTEVAGQPHHVDHIVPLKNKLVCGLHCQANLQVITAMENVTKNNFHWPDMPD